MTPTTGAGAAPEAQDEYEPPTRSEVIDRATDIAWDTFEQQGWTYARGFGESRREWRPSWGELRKAIARLVATVESGEAWMIGSGRIMVCRVDGTVHITLELGEVYVGEDDDEQG